VVFWVLGIGEAEVAANGATLGPPEAWLATSSYLSCRAHITGPIVSTSARGGLGRSILKTIHHPVKAVPTGWDDHGSVPAHMGEEVGEGEEEEGEEEREKTKRQNHPQ